MNPDNLSKRTVSAILYFNDKNGLARDLDRDEEKLKIIEEFLKMELRDCQNKIREIHKIREEYIVGNGKNIQHGDNSDFQVSGILHDKDTGRATD